MDTLIAARWQMAISLGFHIVFAAVGMAMPLLMLLAEAVWLRTGNAGALRLAKTWAKVTGLLFAIGAVSGTALSFELGLLWPRFMAFSGPLVGPAFALEGYAFFIEAIFLGLYLYGWDRLRPALHWLCGWPVALSGAVSGIMVVSVAAWMQSPSGFTLGADGAPTDVEPVAALFNPAWGLMAAHSTLSTYQAVGFAAAGVYALSLLRNRRPDRAHYNRLAVIVALAVATPATVAQPVMGDLLARRAYEAQPVKLAALEGQFRTERGAPLRIGGWPDPDRGATLWALEIPKALSLVASHDPDSEVKGLDAVSRDAWPEPRLVHPAFQVMVGAGLVLLAVAAWFWCAWWLDRRRGRDWAARPRLLRALALCAPLGFLAIEAGWVVTEAGRQPWIIGGVMRTRDAVTPVEGVAFSLAAFALLYTGLAFAVVLLLRRLAAGGRDASPQAQHEVPRVRS